MRFRRDFSQLRIPQPPNPQKIESSPNYCLMGDLPWISVKISATTSRTYRALHKWHRIAHRFALRRPYVDVWRTALLRADFDCLRNRAGGRLNSRLKARLNDASDS